jgi:hypothetical protein
MGYSKLLGEMRLDFARMAWSLANNSPSSAFSGRVLFADLDIAQPP